MSLMQQGGFIVLILLAIIVAIGVPVTLFIIGLVKLRKNKRQGKVILIVATVYSIISFGACSGFGF